MGFYVGKVSWPKKQFYGFTLWYFMTIAHTTLYGAEFMMV